MSTNAWTRRVAIVAAASAGLMVGSPMMAFAKGKPVRSATPASCAVDPGVVAPGQEYAAVGSSLPADRILNVFVVEATGTQAFSVRTDSAGSATVVSRSYWSGPKTVEFRDGNGGLLTTCAFQVEG